ncbi:6-hydroxymethylpterin diphosphokinase MptE-like protein [Zhongshania sp. BJYM1]|uniref:6-hydroxymethylpterin diphosphokinase MptE-like protein n=1 Tax=Zhongshania aquatica TaxID=2965069 RepID=UPI0022B34803|nr:6-hydroxymethylpterin diphosphokinase MptE-like protein [Marortus sp. BJYM1]
MLRFLIFATKPFRYAWDRFTYPASRMTPRIESWKDIYKGKPLLIVGNGPSLNQTPLDEFTGMPSIGMNKIDLMFSKTNWRPSLVVCLNNLVVQQNWKVFKSSAMPVFIGWKCRHFLPRNERSSFNYFLANSGNDFSHDIVNGLGSSATVTYIALQFAYYTGANPVVLFGVDHSFKTEGKPHDIQKRTSDDVNHFDPNYFAKGQFWGVPNLDQSEVEYSMAREVFERDGRKVLDATIGGKLEVFEKISIDDARMIFNITK